MYICKNKLKGVQYLQTILLLIQIILLLTINSIVYKLVFLLNKLKKCCDSNRINKIAIHKLLL